VAIEELMLDTAALERGVIYGQPIQINFPLIRVFSKMTEYCAFLQHLKMLVKLPDISSMYQN